ncbi:NmrA-like family domain-containing protein 1 [Elysia marginata]|uniref:NmrA-like family domain-containing protein 1 n=1 Tax=Elysia marginata TaxID=1093978 RepID=A0AAV4F4N6_9GAST|nr:NmrA-like family domain-containing protein 1 [Elysia marginata]
MCYRLGCPFQNVHRPNDDGFIRVLIFGATGMTGTAVLSAALACIWFKISIFTRGTNSLMMQEMMKKRLPYTILHLGFYYENFLSVFKPHMVERNSFAVALPMGEVALNCGSVLDFGHCIAKIMLRPAMNIFKTIKLATGYHTVGELAQILDDHFPKIHFFDPKIPLSVYRTFDFKGSHELAAMFAYYQTIQDRWSQDLAQDYYSNCASFKEWVVDQEQDWCYKDLCFVCSSRKPVAVGSDIDERTKSPSQEHKTPGQIRRTQLAMATNQYHTKLSSVEDGVSEDGISGDGVSEDGVLKMVFLTMVFQKSEDGVLEDGVSENGVSEDGVSEDGVSEDGVSEDGVLEDGVSEDGVSEDGV